MKSIRKTAGAKSESRSAISRMIGYTFAPPHGAVLLRLSRANPPKTGQGSCAKCAIFPGIDMKSRLKRFVFAFIVVPAKWVRVATQWILNIYTKDRWLHYRTPYSMSVTDESSVSEGLLSITPRWG